MKVRRMAVKFHHFGLLSSRPDVSAARLAALGYEVGAAIVDPLQDAILRMAVSAEGEPTIEIITPRNADSSLGKQIKIRDNSIYHMCYITPDFQEATIALTKNNGRIFEVSAPKSAVLFGGERVAFYFVDGLGLVEIIEGEGRMNTEHLS
jgi:hypothetical protein